MALSWLYLPQERAQVPTSLGTALPFASELSLRCCSLGWPPYFVWRWLWERSLTRIKALLCHLLIGERTRPGLFCSQHKSWCYICLWLHQKCTRESFSPQLYNVCPVAMKMHVTRTGEKIYGMRVQYLYCQIFLCVHHHPNPELVTTNSAWKSTEFMLISS